MAPFERGWRCHHTSLLNFDRILSDAFYSCSTAPVPGASPRKSQFSTAQSRPLTTLLRSRSFSRDCSLDRSGKENRCVRFQSLSCHANPVEVAVGAKLNFRKLYTILGFCFCKSLKVVQLHLLVMGMKVGSIRRSLCTLE